MPTNNWHFLDFLTALDRGTQGMLYANMGFMAQTGLRWMGYLSAMMIVSCGISGAWRHHDWHVVADRFKSLAIGLAIGYSLLQFYNTPIPSTGLPACRCRSAGAGTVTNSGSTESELAS